MPAQLRRPDREAPKGKRVRSVSMVPEVADRLATLKSRKHVTHDDDLVVCNEVGARLCAWKLRRRFYRALEKAGLPRIVFHSLRHCFGTHGIHAWDPEHAAGPHGPSAGRFGRGDDRNRTGVHGFAGTRSGCR